MPTAVQEIVRKLRVQSLTAESDRRLLQAFADEADESAFTEIVRRHGPLVLGVARRILGNVQDAEDVFQATFLVLARKANSVPWRDSIKNWLHGVAVRIAMKARGRALRRKEKEAQAAAQQTTSAPVEAWHELRGILDQEIERLPAKYREVLILCYLEGKTRDEAADLLGWSIGSVKGCLERGRDLLRDRLSKRGLALSAALSAGLLSEATVGAASIPAVLCTATVQSAIQFTAGSACHAALAQPVIQLAQGALNTMMIAKLKTVGALTLMLAFGTTAFWGVYQTGAGSAAVTQVARGQDVFPVAFQQEGRRDEVKKKADYLGLIKAIDLKVGTITLSSLRDGEGGGDSTFSLASKELKVASTMGVALKLSDLTVGTRVQLELKEMDVLAIHVEHATVPAFLTSIDADKRTIEARAERMNAHYAVAANAKITVRGKEATLKEVPLEERVFLTLSLDKKTVLAMNANSKGVRDGERPKEKGAGDRPKERPIERPSAVSSTIIDIDAGKNSINVLAGRPDDLSIQTVAVAKDLKVKVMFEEKVVQEVPLSQLTKPVTASIQWSDDKKTVTALTVNAPMIRSAFKSVDSTGKKITVMVVEREEKTFDLDADVPIRGPGREAGKLADLKPGAPLMLGLSLDRTRVIGITVPQPTRREGDRD